MKPLHSNTRTKAKKPAKSNFDQALRECESAASRVKAAGEELSACWTALGIEIANGAAPTQLLRRRAWCNVLELRLKEKAATLEAARHAIDASWDDLMQAAREHQSKPASRSKVAAENVFSKSWSLLLQPKFLSKAKVDPIARAL